MVSDFAKNGRLNTLVLVLLLTTVISIFFTFVQAEPVGPSITILSNTSKVQAPGTVINSTINGSTPGGFIFTISLTSQQQNSRWKGYVGNVTGTLTLDDASDNTLFQWSLTTITGEVYASRGSTVNWTGINCTWISENLSNASGYNRTIEELENTALSHSSVDDNITATFSTVLHPGLVIGSRVIGQDECYSLHTYQRDAAQTFTDSTDANFSQVLLYDGAFGTTGGNIVYGTPIEPDVVGFDQTETYDFQMIVPEDGSPGFTASTGYYFYVELS